MDLFSGAHKSNLRVQPVFLPMIHLGHFTQQTAEMSIWEQVYKCEFLLLNIHPGKEQNNKIKELSYSLKNNCTPPFFFLNKRGLGQFGEGVCNFKESFLAGCFKNPVDQRTRVKLACSVVSSVGWTSGLAFLLLSRPLVVFLGWLMHCCCGFSGHSQKRIS